MNLKNPSLLIFFVLMAFVALHLPFLTADPDAQISEGRGPHTDEGLNTCQIRNYVNHGELTLYKSDNLIKTPLFGFSLYLPFSIFGTSLAVARLSILFFSVLMLWFFGQGSAYFRALLLVFLGIGGCEFFIFHHFHYSLAEMPCALCILLSVLVLINSLEKENYIKSTFAAVSLLSASYYFKIQFLYIIPILPIILSVFIVFKLAERRKLLKQLLYTVFFIIIYLLLYFLLWYLPHSDFYDRVMHNQTVGRFVGFSELGKHLSFVWGHHFHNSYLSLHSYTFYVLLLAGVFLLIKGGSSRYKALFTAVLVWILIEMHKLPMTYLPSRYLISFYLAMTFLMAVVLWELWQFTNKKSLKAACLLVFMLLMSKNVLDYSSAFGRKTYHIAQVDNYLSQFHFDKKEPIAGAWAASLSWRSGALSFPVWKDYFNDVDSLLSPPPRILIAEADEEDSNQAFSSRGIAIDSIADSTQHYKICHWQIKLLWMKR